MDLKIPKIGRKSLESKHWNQPSSFELPPSAFRLRKLPFKNLTELATYLKSPERHIGI